MVVDFQNFKVRIWIIFRRWRPLREVDVRSDHLQCADKKVLNDISLPMGGSLPLLDSRLSNLVPPGLNVRLSRLG
jgi:hypothetical protein